MIKAKYFYFLLTALTIAALFWIYINILNYGKSSFSLSVCMIKNVSGYPCASCGTTRSVLAFLKGDLPHAIFQNPLGILVAIGIIATPFILIFDLITGKKIAFKTYNHFITNLSQKKYWLTLLLFFISLWIWNLYKYINHLN